MSAKVRQAIEVIATEGKTQRDAAAAVGMNESALSRALARPGVQDVLDAKRATFSLEVDQLRATAKKRAILVGMELMEKSGSDSVRAKMVEFFAGETKPGMQVNIQNNVRGGAYEYAPRGARIVEINPDADTTAGCQDDESPTE